MKRELTEDEALIFSYLQGDIAKCFEDSGITVPSRRNYLKSGSSDERKARQALAKMLRGDDPVLFFVREQLASLLDPDDKYNPRQIKIAFRRRGTRTDVVRDTEIATFIKDEVNAHGKVEAAFAAATKKFGMSRSAVARIWGWKRPTFEALGELDKPSPNKS